MGGRGRAGSGLEWMDHDNTGVSGERMGMWGWAEARCEVGRGGCGVAAAVYYIGWS